MINYLNLKRKIISIIHVIFFNVEVAYRNDEPIILLFLEMNSEFLMISLLLTGYFKLKH